MTKKRRINLVVDDDIHETITELARLQDKSRAGLIMDLMREIHPALLQTIAAIKAAQERQGRLPNDLAEAINTALAYSNASADSQLDMMKELTESMRARSGEAGGADAPAPERSS